MRVPLIVLSVLSVVSGIWAHMAGFGDWVRFGGPAHEGMNLMIAGTSTLLAVIALALAWKVYVAKSWDADVLAEKWGVLYQLSFHKFYIDEIYAALIKFFVDGIAKVLYWIDVHIVDGIVNALGGLVRAVSEMLSPAENGQVQSYAGVYLFGVIVLLAYGVYYASKLMAMLGGAF